VRRAPQDAAAGEVAPATGTDLTDGAPRRSTSASRDLIRRILKNPTGITGVVIVSFFVLASVLAPVVAPYNARTDRNLEDSLQAPSANHLFGTDVLGRDSFTRVLHGGRVSLRVGLLAVGIAAIIGIFVGLLAGYFGGKLDIFVGWFVDMLLAFPGILLAIAIVAALGPSLSNALLAISLTQVPVYIRITRSIVMGLRGSEYVQAARALGSRAPRIMVGHILPNSLSAIIVQLTLSIGVAILDVAALGFLGLGAQPPTPEWGLLIREGYRQASRAPWLALFPGLAIFFSVVGFNLLGDAIRDALDPRLRRA